jgi:hypothetical protein
MLIIAYIFTGISALSGLVAGILGCILGYHFISAFDSIDKITVGGLLVISLLYVANPLLAIWLIKMDKLIWCYLYNALTLIIGLGLNFVLITFVGFSGVGESSS